MALEERIVRTQPIYWTAAQWKRVPGKGLMWQGYTPPVKATWSAWLARLMYQSEHTDLETRSYYWDGGKWIYDKGSASAGVIGAEPTAGKLERRNPLPAGRYWQDIFDKQAHDWNEWVAPKVKDGSVKIVNSENFWADPWRDGSWLPEALKPANAGSIPNRFWVLFDVTKPVEWPAVKLGFPTIADASIRSSSDTADNPPGPSPGDEIADALMNKVVTPALTITGIYLGIKLLLGLRK